MNLPYAVFRIQIRRQHITRTEELKSELGRPPRTCLEYLPRIYFVVTVWNDIKLFLIILSFSLLISNEPKSNLENLN